MSSGISIYPYLNCYLLHNDLEIMKVDIISAYLNTPMNDDVKHKWLTLDKDAASVLMSINENY